MFAKQCGGHGARVTAAHELDAAVATALAVKGPSLVEIVTDPELV
jgi:thiamine pyrophosphate-dependent acetolactate synthase large subunit-like protein